MSTFICLKIKFSNFALLSIFKLIKSNKVVYKPIKIENKKIKQNDLINQKYFTNVYYSPILYKKFALQKAKNLYKAKI